MFVRYFRGVRAQSINPSTAERRRRDAVREKSYCGGGGGVFSPRSVYDDVTRQLHRKSGDFFVKPHDWRTHTRSITGTANLCHVCHGVTPTHNVSDTPTLCIIHDFLPNLFKKKIKKK